jgi:hypothetical protein
VRFLISNFFLIASGNPCALQIFPTPQIQQLLRQSTRSKKIKFRARFLSELQPFLS